MTFKLGDRVTVKALTRKHILKQGVMAKAEDMEQINDLNQH